MRLFSLPFCWDFAYSLQHRGGFGALVPGVRGNLWNASVGALINLGGRQMLHQDYKKAGSNVADHAAARAKRVGLDTQLLQHPHEEIRKQCVLFAVVADVAGVLVAAAAEQDGQVRVVV